jgi:hypothetical protein
MVLLPRFASRPSAPPLRLILAAFLLSLPVPIHSAGSTTEIAPGPRSITPEEQALAPDAASGAQHGIILMDEMEQDDTAHTSRIHRHVRAKIFTNEGRGLSDVEITLGTGRELKKWWGWTILPDGSVRELKQEDLQEQESARSGRTKVRVLKGPLPGAVPGCVLDYGYLLVQKGVYGSTWMRLQKGWPIRNLSYRWRPLSAASSVRMARATGMDLEAFEGPGLVEVTGKNLPASVDEPWMPPVKEVAASVTFYYTGTFGNERDFWRRVAAGKTLAARQFIKGGAIKEALATMSFPEKADIYVKLRTVHAWIVANIRNSGLRTSEQAEEENQQGASPTTAREVLAEKTATSRQMDFLFMGFARALGAEADLVLATDRTDHFFDPGILTADQFDASLVMVRVPGDTDEQATLVDTGTGLPFGEVPWWVSGARGMLISDKGYRMVMLTPSDTRKNRSETHVSVAFRPADQTAAVRWTRTDSGQAGLSDRLDLRSLGPGERDKRLQELCGAGGEFEVSRAEAPGLQNLTSGLKLDCEGTMMSTNLTPGLSRYSFSLDGFWNEEVPEFTEEHRVHAVVFPFPRIDRTVVDVKSPEGFTTVEAPAVPPVESPYGRYTLTVSLTPDGYHVERMFALAAIAVKAQDYPSLRQFLSGVHRADQTALEFRKGGQS